MGVLAVSWARACACAALFLAVGGARAETQIESSESKDGVSGEIHATVDHPFAVTAAALKDPANWCAILMLHLDTKECHIGTDGSATLVNVGVVSKYDQPASSAYRVTFAYRLVEDTPNALRVGLDADKGPLGTSNYRIVLEAAPVDEGRTAIHMSYSYSYGVLANIAMQAYLVTFGRNKVGFTIVGNEADGKPRYMGGTRGVVERNTMRYYLAVAAYLDALSSPPESRTEASLANWYSAIERYPRQLHEMERADYLAMKRRELTGASAR
jgi:hypothetical protein